MRLPNHALTTFHTHPQPLALPSSSAPSLLTLCQRATPPCTLNPLLFNAHLQTFYTTLKTHADIPIHYRRHIFTATAPAGTFAVDFLTPSSKASETEERSDATLPPRTTYYTDAEFEDVRGTDGRPMVVVLHGLSGGSHELYLRHVLKPLEEKGWEGCVVNSRGCAGSEVTSGLLYNARATWDLRQVVGWLRERFPNRRLFGVGFSLGGNVLVNYLGEEGEGCELTAAVVCSNPWNLEVGSLALQRTWLGREVYSRTMGTSMKALFERHVDAISKNPRVDIERVRNIKYLYEFDRELQGPTWGYPTEGAYYRDASSSDSLLAVRIPLFAINAEDDPIAVKEAIPFQEFQQNPFTVLCTTSLGGHLSWFETGGGRWFAKPASQFLIKVFEEVDLDRLPEMSKVRMATGNVDGEPFATFKPMRRKLQIAAEGYY